MSWAVVRVRGSVNVKPKIKETMKLMRLNRVNHCVIIPERYLYRNVENYQRLCYLGRSRC